MTQIVLCSAKGSPGVTTLACALAAVWPPDRGVVVAECDPSGGDLAARFGLSPRLGMTSLVLAHRQGLTDGSVLDAHTQRLPGGLEVLPAPVGAEAATALDRELGIVGTSPLLGRADVIIDCGRIISGASGQRALIQGAGLVILVVRPDVAGVANAQALVERVRAYSATIPLVAVPAGTAVFTNAEIQEAIGTELLEQVPVDPKAAATLGGMPGSSRVFGRSRLVSWARRQTVLICGMLDSLSKAPDLPGSGLMASTGK